MRNPRRLFMHPLQTAALFALAVGMAGALQPAMAAKPEPSVAADKAATYGIEVEGDLYIGTDGSVRDYKLQSRDLTPEIAAAVDKRIRDWRFEPILVDGQPVVAKTKLKLQLQAEPIAEGYRLRVASIGFGGPQLNRPKLAPPRYPESALRAGVEADVTLVLRLDQNGRVTEAEAEQTSLSGKGPERIMREWAEIFEKNALSTARRWSFQLTEEVGGETAAMTSVRIPVKYRMSGREGWRAMVPVGPRKPLPWADAETGLASVAPVDLKDGETQSLDSRFKLKDKMVGTLL